MNFNEDYEKIFFLYTLRNNEFFKYYYEGFFNNEYIDILAYISSEFNKKYNESPTKSQLKLLVSRSKYSEKISNDVFESVFDTNLDEYEKEWLDTTCKSFIKWRNFDKQLIRMNEYVKIQRPNPENIDDIITKSINMIYEKGNVSFDNDIGLNLYNADDHKQKVSNKIKSGYEFIDSITNGGYDTKSFVCYIGMQNIGKSIWLANCAAMCTQMGFNTVYITAEMADYKVMKRIGSNLLNIPMKEYDKLSMNKDLISRKLKLINNGILPPGKLYVKEYPTSQATTLDIDSYIKKVEETTGEKIHVVIIDYINILCNYRNPNSENTYMKIKQISEDLRAIAVRRDLLMISATQTGKQNWDSTDIKAADIAESAGLAHTADIIYGIIQDETMKANNEYWLKVLKMRDGEGKGIKCKFNIDYNYMRLYETKEIIQISEV